MNGSIQVRKIPGDVMRLREVIACLEALAEIAGDDVHVQMGVMSGTICSSVRGMEVADVSAGGASETMVTLYD